MATKKKAPAKKKARKKPTRGKRPPLPPGSESTGPKGINWPKYRERYVTSIDKITYAEIAEEAGVNPTTVEKRAAEEGWREQRKDHFTAISREWREICKHETNAIKLESLQAIRATKSVILRHLARGLVRNASVNDLVQLVKQELNLLGEPDFTGEISHGVDNNILREALKTAIEKGQLDRTALRRAAKNAG